MKEKILVPDIGDFDAVEIIEILVKAGDVVAVEQSLLTLESDKATMDLPAPVAGTVVEVLVKAGDKIKQGDAIASIETACEAPAVSATSATTEATAIAQPVEAASSAQASPPSTVAESEVVEIRVPDIGDFKSVEIIDLCLAIGDTVAVEQSLLTLESDKATMDVPSPVAGQLQQWSVAVGDKISEGDLIAIVKVEATAASSADDVSAPPAANVAPVPSVPPVPAASTAPTTTDAPPPPVNESVKAHAGPAVRHFARELGVNLLAVTGSGRNGRIRKEDVQRYVKETLTQPATVDSGSALPTLPEIDFSQFGEVEVQPLSRINKLSAKTLHRNWLIAPHVTQCGIADITDMEDFRQSMAAEAKKNGYKMTPLIFLIKAAVSALRQFPRFNASLQTDNEHYVLKKYYHIGVAIDTPNGLVVPVLRDADRKGLTDIARELADISARARAGQLKREEMQGGCFTLSSLGGIGGSFFTPIINLPEVAILGVSRAEIKPHWDGQQFLPRRHLPLSLSYDHRLIDGADGARFITYYAELLGDIRRLAL